MVKFGLRLILKTFNVFFLQSCGQVNKGSAKICYMEKGINQGSEANEVRKDRFFFVFLGRKTYIQLHRQRFGSSLPANCSF